MNEIQIIPSHQINTERWNACLHSAPNGLIYAEKSYLDQMAEQWIGLVLNDYDAIFPLAWKKKWGIRYGYQPAFIQQLGLFGKQEYLNELILKEMMVVAMNEVRFAEITLNHANMDLAATSLKMNARTNYLLKLDGDTESMRQSLHQDVQEKLRRAAKWELQYEALTNPSEIILAYKSLYQSKQGLTNSDYLNFEALMQIYQQSDRLVLRCVRANGSGDWLAAVLMVQDGRRLYNLASCLRPEGRKNLANYVLFDQLIQEFAHTGWILDFEGSDIPGIAYFYEQFASNKETYPFMRWNQLPGLLKWVKG